MSLAPAAETLIKIQTPLQQLLMDINFQRTKELRQLTKEESGFVVLQGTTYWTDLFVRHFLFQLETIHTVDSDDLLFFVRKKHLKNSSRHMPKYKTEVDVFRKDSRKLPIGDPDVDWEETVYLNMVLHQFDYTLTLAICTRTSPKELQVLQRHTQRVYASPSRRKMDTKGEGEEMIYPHICFMVDNFDEVLSEILVRDGEMVCVELVANDKNGAVQGVIFLGSIRYDALKKVYDGRQSSLSSKVAQRMSFGLFSGGVGVQTRCEFVRMKGPQGKGYAEMAVTKPKGCGAETPNSEPGFCATYKWDDWDEDSYNYYLCHQRRLSDPSSNVNNFAKYNWLPKIGTKIVGSTELKSRSVNDGLDTLANEVSEIEAGDIKDDQGPTFVTSEMKSTTSKKIKETINAGVESPTNTSTGCSIGFRSNTCKPWPFTKMREIYCPTCEDVFKQTSAYFTNIPITRSKDQTFLGIDSELIVGQDGNLSNGKINKLSRNTFLANTIRNEKLSKRTEIQKQKVKTDTKSVAKNDTTPKISGKCCINQKNTVLNYSSKGRHHDAKAQEYEIADDATTLTGGELSSSKYESKIAILRENYTNLKKSVHGEEELPVVAESRFLTSSFPIEVLPKEISRYSFHFEKCTPVKSEGHTCQFPVNENKISNAQVSAFGKVDNNKCRYTSILYNDCNSKSKGKEFTYSPVVRNCARVDFQFPIHRHYTLPRVKKSSTQRALYNKAIHSVRKRRTPDGTTVYYWCDLSKKATKDQGPTFVTSEMKSTTSKKIKETINAGVESPTNTSTGCSIGFRSNTCKPWPFTKMREIYCPTCEDVFKQTSAYFTNIPITRSKDQTFLGIDSELIVGQDGNLSNGKINKLSRNTFLANTIRNEKLSKRTEIQKQKVKTDTKSVAKNDTTPKISGKCCINQKNTVLNYSSKGRHHDAKAQEYEIADDATTLTGGELSSSKYESKIAILRENYTNLKKSVHGEEELPVVAESRFLTSSFPIEVLPKEISRYSFHFEKCTPVKSEGHTCQFPVNENKISNAQVSAFGKVDNNKCRYTSILYNDCNSKSKGKEFTYSPVVRNCARVDFQFPIHRHYTLPRVKKSSTQRALYNKAIHSVRKRRTPDGTTVYYWCDLSKKATKELDNGAFNPLWASRGFTQNFYFWKENRRQQSTPLNAFLTYITLPWWSITKDLLDHRETPILTF